MDEHHTERPPSDGRARRQRDKRESLATIRKMVTRLLLWLAVRIVIPLLIDIWDDER